ncbi:MAG: pyrroline-5-carboxylate reductase [Clostridia bacterium]|nr:pyrroline-5-carboxylate reductase [Clostridia bacterium]
MRTAGFIGCGNMGSALARAAANAAGPENVYVCDVDSQKVRAFAEETDVNLSDAEYIAGHCDYIFLAVKPQMLREAVGAITAVLEERTTDFVVVSMAAGVPLKTIESLFGFECPVIRIMPNIPAAAGKGLVLYAPNLFADRNDVADFCELMQDAGLLDKIEESKIDAASCVSGCGPAFVYLFIEALADGAVKCGLPRDKALLYAAQTLIGSSEMLLQSGRHPGELKDAVCSPAGSTIEGVKALEEGAFRADVINAVVRAYERTLELGK